ncbi:hypothetical protein [Nocardioides sp. Arc9.136]|uniref:hypothetical protein n=1 Tax=Nocardioides sp. Arc9.136 TaxID=2996826 RepID=UPI002665817F|nr:hypothetical protein [Nocardioides sp. Arc9.136]WKN49334.1 hypothetical protein OSR43_04200 [Nocardioides sp. Arc9.136]
MTYAPVIVTQADVEQAWRSLMRPLGWTRTSTWLMLVGPDDRPLPHLTEIEDCGGPPPPGGADRLGELLAGLVRGALPPGVRVAFLRSRPGAGLADDDDRAWARTLLAAAQVAGLRSEVVHLATDVDVLPLPVDEPALPAGA